MKNGRNQSTNIIIDHLGKQVIYQDDFQGNYSGTFTGSMQGTFSGTTTGIFTGSTEGTFSGTAIGTFSGSASGSFTGSFMGYVSGALIFTPVVLTAAIHGVVVTGTIPSLFKGPPIGFIPYYAISGSRKYKYLY